MMCVRFAHLRFHFGPQRPVGGRNPCRRAWLASFCHGSGLALVVSYSATKSNKMRFASMTLLNYVLDYVTDYGQNKRRHTKKPPKSKYVNYVNSRPPEN